MDAAYITPEPAEVEEVFGYLQFADGTDCCLDGSYEQLDNGHTPADIVDFGTADIGDEAHLFVVFSNGEARTLDTLESIRDFFTAVENS